MKRLLLFSLVLLFTYSSAYAQKQTTSMKNSPKKGAFKAMFLAKKRDDMTTEQFNQYELETHAPLVTSIPGLRGYEVNLAIHSNDEQTYDAVAPYDIIVSLWFDSMEDFQKGMSSKEAQTAIADQPNFLKEKAVMIVVEEHDVQVDQ